MKATVLFGRPQAEIASELAKIFAAGRAIHSVVGFATVEGVERLRTGLLGDPSKLKTFVLGASTYRGFEALDRLIAGGVNPDNVFVHLGHTRPYSAPTTFHK
jgi:hypothetical protein